MNLQQEQKGLFTFYREQQQFESEIKERKKQIKLQKQKEKQEREREKQLAIERQREKQEQRQLQLQQLREKIQTERKLLYEPRHKQQKYERKKLGQSVMVVHQKRNRSNPEEQKRGKIFKKQEEKEKPQGYFLQNKEVPFTFGQVSLEKQMVDPNDPKKRQILVPMHYYNQYEYNDEGKYIETYSYEKLPEVKKKKVLSTVFPKLQKSKRIEIALREGNSEILRKIKYSAKQEQEIKQQKIAFIEYGSHHYEEKPIPQLNDKQRKIIQIINMGRKRYKQ